jgi:uncharacterized protein (TIRG00374 family)
LTLLKPFPGAKALGWAGFACVATLPVVLPRVLDFSKIVTWICKGAQRHLPAARTKEALDQVTDAFSELLRTRMWRPVVLTVVTYLLFFCQCYLVSRALDLPATFFTLAAAMAMTNLIALLPISIAGLGTREAALFLLLGSTGVSLEFILTYSMAIFIVTFVVTGLMGSVASWIIQ